CRLRGRAARTTPGLTSREPSRLSFFTRRARSTAHPSHPPPGDHHAQVPVLRAARAGTDFASSHARRRHEPRHLRDRTTDAHMERRRRRCRQQATRVQRGRDTRDLPGLPSRKRGRTSGRGGISSSLPLSGGSVRMRLRMLACLVAALVCVPALATAQTSSMFSNLANPAIGMNALFSGLAARNINQPYGLQFDDAEISLISVVDPYWTFVSNIVFVGDGSVDPEEVWVRSLNIPAVQLKLGKIRGTFGKHGLLHTHAFPFIQAPIVMANTIGDEGSKAAGREAAWLTPLPWFSEVTGGVYEAIPTDGDHPLDFGSTRHDNVPYLGHFKNQFDVNDATTLELGQSILQGRGSDGARHAAYGADVTLRNVPARNSNRRGWILQSEYLQKGSS